MGNELKYSFKVNIGDWSDDGHGKKNEYVIESNCDVLEVQTAFIKTLEDNPALRNDCPRTHSLSFCHDYESSRIPANIVEILNNLGIVIDDEFFYMEDDGSAYVEDTSNFVYLLMSIAKVSLPNFEWKFKESDGIPNFNGYWSNTLNSSFGYGLYN